MSDRKTTENIKIRTLIFRGSDKTEEFIFRKLRVEVNTSVLKFRIPTELVIVSRKTPKKKSVNPNLFFSLGV